MTESVILVCRVDSLNDKRYIDEQVSTILKQFKSNVKGRRSDLTPVSDIERTYVFHKLSMEDANKLKSLAKEHKTKLRMKSIVIDSEQSATPPTPPPSPALVVPSPIVSIDSISPSTTSSVSSDTKSLVLNFGVGRSTNSDGPSPSSTTTGNSFFSSDSETSGVGVGTAITTPEILLLRELAEIMKVESVKPTPSQIGKAVSAWFVSDTVQKVMRRIV